MPRRVSSASVTFSSTAIFSSSRPSGRGVFSRCLALALTAGALPPWCVHTRPPLIAARLHLSPFLRCAVQRCAGDLRFRVGPPLFTPLDDRSRSREVVQVPQTARRPAPRLDGQADFEPAGPPRGAVKTRHRLRSDVGQEMSLSCMHHGPGHGDRPLRSGGSAHLATCDRGLRRLWSVTRSGPCVEAEGSPGRCREARDRTDL